MINKFKEKAEDEQDFKDNKITVTLNVFKDINSINFKSNNDTDEEKREIKYPDIEFETEHTKSID